MPETRKEKVLRFRVEADPKTPFSLFDRYFPSGQQVLNRTEWWGKEPRSCAVTNLHSTSTTADRERQKIIFDVEVTYRPKGIITYVGNTKYDGWTAMLLDVTADGTLLDGHGKPLPPGAEPVYRAAEVYADVEFNDVDFGEFLEEADKVGILHRSYDDVIREVHEIGKFTASIDSTFFAPRRQRPNVRIVLTEVPMEFSGGDFGTRKFMIDKNAPQLKKVILDQLYDVLAGFLEGRYSLKSISTDDIEFVELDDCMVEFKGIEPQNIESVFNVIWSYVSPDDMDELAKQLMAVYMVDVAVVDGSKGGFVMKRIAKR